MAGEEPSTGPFPRRFGVPEPADLAAHFPQLEIAELLGQGGMGVVYKARQLKLDRPVALKILPAEAGSDPHFAERFLREGRALARLSHSHIVAVHDFGESGGVFYFLMEYVDGTNLRQLMRSGPLSPSDALCLVSQVCDALQYAHDEGVVHRDIKPENILVDKRGRVKIADFGLAKLLGFATASAPLTGSHQVMGTPHYMAPEQWEKPHTVDHRADIYALGVVLYEMLTGELPLGRFAAPSQRKSMDGRLDQVVLRALEKDPEQRYQQVSQLRTELESVVKELPAPARLSTQGKFTDAATLTGISQATGADRQGAARAGDFSEQKHTGLSLDQAALVAVGAGIVCLVVSSLLGSGPFNVGIPLGIVLFGLVIQTGAAARSRGFTRGRKAFLQIMVAVAGALIALFVFCPPFEPRDYFNHDLKGIKRVGLLLQFGILMLIFLTWKVIAGPWSLATLSTTSGRAILVCLLGALAALLPWAYEESRNGPAFEVNALSFQQGQATTALFLVVGLFLITANAVGWMPPWRPYALIGAGILIVVFSIWYINSVLTGTVTPSSQLPIWFPSGPSSYGVYHFLSGLYLAVALGVGLVLLGVIEFCGQVLWPKWKAFRARRLQTKVP